MAWHPSAETLTALQGSFVNGVIDVEELEARVEAVLLWRDEMVERGLLPWTYVWPWSTEADDWHRARLEGSAPR